MYELPQTDSGASCQLKCLKTVESKGGPIQAMAVSDVTRLGTQDLVITDSRGMVTLFSNQQILERRSVSQHCVPCLQLQTHALGKLSIVVGDTMGHLCSFAPFTDKWRLRLGDSKHNKKLMSTPRLCSLLAVDLNSQFKQSASYILAADDTKHLYFIQDGIIVLILNTPSVVTAMCAGKFIDASDIETETGDTNGIQNGKHACETQVALGTNTGAIYIMTNFEIVQEEYASVQHPVTNLLTLPTAPHHGTDTLICTGQFNAVCLIRDGKVKDKIETPSWVTCMARIDKETDKSTERVVVGCVDRSILAIETT